LSKNKGLYKKSPPPQEYHPSYLQRNGGSIQSNLNINPMMTNLPLSPPQSIINNSLIHQPSVIPLSPSINDTFIQNPMVNSPGYYSPPPSLFYGRIPQRIYGGIIPNPAVPSYLDYEFNKELNMRKHNMRLSNSYPKNTNNLINNYSNNSDNKDEPLGNIYINSLKRNKKNRYYPSSEYDTESETVSGSDTETETESDSETVTESSSGSETESLPSPP